MEFLRLFPVPHRLGLELGTRDNTVLGTCSVLFITHLGVEMRDEQVEFLRLFPVRHCLSLELGTRDITCLGPDPFWLLHIWELICGIQPGTILSFSYPVHPYMIPSSPEIEPKWLHAQKFMTNHCIRRQGKRQVVPFTISKHAERPLNEGTGSVILNSARLSDRVSETFGDYISKFSQISK